MSTFAVAVTKQVQWREFQQPFSNVYHYSGAPGDEFDDEGVANAVLAAEQEIHGSNITFTQVRTYGPTDQGAAANVNRTVQDFNSVGLATADGSYYRELAWLVIWPLGRYGPRNHPHWLRKWLHTSTFYELTATSTSGEVPLYEWPPPLDTYASAVTQLQDSTTGSVLTLAAPDGRTPIDNAKGYPYLEHRQLGDLWRSGRPAYFNLSGPLA